MSPLAEPELLFAEAVVARRSDTDPPAGVPPDVWLYLQTVHPDEAAERAALIGTLFRQMEADDKIDLREVHRALVREIEARVWANYKRRFREEKLDPLHAPEKRARHHLRLAAEALREMVATTPGPHQMSDDDLIKKYDLILFAATPKTVRPVSRGGAPVAAWKTVDRELKRAGMSEYGRRRLLDLLGLREDR